VKVNFLTGETDCKRAVEERLVVNLPSWLPEMLVLREMFSSPRRLASGAVVSSGRGDKAFVERRCVEAID
jgi:hypothetical protein